MEQFSSLNIFLIISLIILFFSIPFLFISTLQNTIKATNPKNRTIEPYEVWLYFIPVIGFFFHFNHILKITNTLKNDFEDKKINHDNERLFGANFGLSYCLINIGYLFYGIYKISTYSNDDRNFLSLAVVVLIIVSGINFIIFWSKMAKCKRILLSMNFVTNDHHENNLNQDEDCQIKNIDKKTCLKCGSNLPFEQKFCMECGSSDFKLNSINTEKSEKIIINENEKECPSCKFIINKDNEKCEFCDYDFNPEGIPTVNDFQIDSHKLIIEHNDIDNSIIENKVKEDADYVEKNIKSKNKYYAIIIILLLIGFFVWHNFLNKKSNESIETSISTTSITVPIDTIPNKISISDTPSVEENDSEYSQTVEDFSFKDYIVNENYISSKAKINYQSSSTATEFKTIISETYNSKKVDFAGYYITIFWGCGTGCVSGVMVDVRDGKIYDLPLSEETVNYECYADNNPEDDEGVVFKSFSRLFVTTKCSHSEMEGSNNIKQSQIYYLNIWNEQKKKFEFQKKI